MEQGEAKQRTSSQNKSFHKFCELLAEELNAHGVTQADFAKCFEVDNTKESIKAVLREAGFKKYLKKSTVEWTTKEIQSIYEETVRVLAMHPEWKVNVIDWPSYDKKSFLESYK